MKPASEAIKLTQEAINKITEKARAYLTKFMVRVEFEIERAAKDGQSSCSILNLDQIPQDIKKDVIRMFTQELRSAGYRYSCDDISFDIFWSSEAHEK